MSMNMAVVEDKLHAIIEKGRNVAIQGMTALEQEYKLRRDLMVRPAAMDIEVAQDGRIVALLNREPVQVTGHSRGQLLSRARLTQQVADTMIDLGLPDLLRYNFQKMLPKASPEGTLFRVVNGTAKGVLSPSYRRLDGAVTFEGFVQMCLKGGLVPYNGLVTDTRSLITFIEPKIRRVSDTEAVVMGVELRTSDYGNGALQMAVQILRLLCTNGMVGMSMFKQIHLGRRFDLDANGSQGPVITLSNKTLELDARTVTSAMTDVMKSLPAHFDSTDSWLRATVGKDVKVSDALASLNRAGVRKEIQERVKEAYENDALPIEAVPQEKGVWRMANVLSWLANDSKISPDEAIDLRDAAHALLGTPKKVAA